MVETSLKPKQDSIVFKDNIIAIALNLRVPLSVSEVFFIKWSIEENKQYDKLSPLESLYIKANVR